MASQRDESASAGSHRIAGAVVVLLGFLSIVAHGSSLAKVQGIAAVTLTIVLPSLLGVVLIGVGYKTAREELVSAEDAWRVAGWVVAGMVVFLLVGVWIVVLDVILGQSVSFGFLITVNAVTLGGVAGAVIGLYDAQVRAYTRKVEQRERELEAQNERLDEFVSIVSHDLRNPLDVATARLEFAQQECTSEHLDHVAQAHQRMESLIDDLLELARQEESATEIESVTLAGAIENCWQTVETAEAELNVEADLVIEADRSQLQQLLENLFRNAIEHGDDDVTITIGELDDSAGFYVADDGPGIPEDKQEQVFASGYTTRSGGTGFGLSIVKEIVDSHGWTIGVTTGQEGGARFEISAVEVTAT